MPHQLLRHQSPRQPPRLPRLNRNEPERPHIISASKVRYDRLATTLLLCQSGTNPPIPVIETVIQEEALQPPAPDTSFELPVGSPPAPLPIGTWSLEEYDYDDYAKEISMSVFDAENQI